jgi:putative transposase
VPARRRACVEHIIDVLHISERRACRALGQHRSTQRKVPRGRDDEEALTADRVALAEQYGRYGYRKISALLKAAGWLVNDKRVERDPNYASGPPRGGQSFCPESSEYLIDHQA